MAPTHLVMFLLPPAWPGGIRKGHVLCCDGCSSAGTGPSCLCSAQSVTGQVSTLGIVSGVRSKSRAASQLLWEVSRCSSMGSRATRGQQMMKGLKPADTSGEPGLPSSSSACRCPSKQDPSTRGGAHPLPSQRLRLSRKELSSRNKSFAVRCDKKEENAFKRSSFISPSTSPFCRLQLFHSLWKRRRRRKKKKGS